jgi:hypothetical protein
MYATIEQADKYIESYYSSTDSLREAWENLDDEDKQVLLNRAERIIDQLPYTGRPKDIHKAFPRYPDHEYSLEQAMYATIELAIHQLDEVANERAELQAQGVKSYKIGDLSETFRDKESSLIDTHSYSIVYPFLKNWMGGSFRICPTHIRR